MSELYDLTNETLRCWVDATGVGPSAKAVNDWIRLAQDVDATGLTTYLYLRDVLQVKWINEPNVVGRTAVWASFDRFFGCGSRIERN